MRKLVILFFLLAVAFPASAARRINGKDLEQTLASAHGRPDAEVAQELSDLELTERLSSPQLAKLKAEMPGENSRQALIAMADAAEFMTLPAAEIPATPPPVPSAQRQIMGLVVNYVTKSTHQLPNFFATRDTSRFEDNAHLTAANLPLHLVTRSSRQVFYRDGKEMVITDAGKTKTAGLDAQGLVSWGEFGPILGTVLLDAAQSKLAWSHWEQGASGSEAVFSYQVPSQKSHYSVRFCCVMETSGDAQPPFNGLAGYHGEMAVNPENGAILRLTLEADFPLESPLIRAAIMVEYGNVDIGGKTFTCPIRSVAISRVKVSHNSMGAQSVLIQDPLKTYLNDVAFGQFHRLGSEARILTADGTAPSVGLPPLDSAIDPSLQPLTAAPANPADAASPGPAPTPSPAIPTPPAPAATDTPAAVPPPPAEPEMSIGVADKLPDAPPNPSGNSDGPVVLKITSRLVDVGVVVVDKKGHPVKDLKPEDFEVYDNGRKETVKFFSAIVGGGSAATGIPAQSSSVAAGQTFSNQPAAASAIGDNAVKPMQLPVPNSTILLIDESHIAWSDLSNARSEMFKFLASLDPNERVGLYAISGLGFHVLTETTTDHAAIVTRLKKWMPTAQSASQAHESEVRNRQQFETVHNAADLNSVNGNQTEVPDANIPVDPQLLNMGDNPGRASLIILRAVARHLSAVPGHKSLVWISSDNVLVNWNDLDVGTNKSVADVDTYALHAQEAMNEAHVAVYPFDVSQLEAGGINADTENRNVELDPTTTPPGGVPRDMTAGRTKASMLQDLRPIQGPIRDLAAGTGGRIIRRSGDLAAELGSIVEDGHATYQLSFYPDTPADDRYHSVLVKIVDKKGVFLRGRTGYLYSREPATLKERFQQAIWLPADASEIRVSAIIDRTQTGAGLKITVATSDLGLQQQAGRWMDKLDFFFIQRDDAGLHAVVDGQTLGLRLSPATYQTMLPTGVPFDREVTLKPGMASLRVLVVDENSGRMGSATIPSSALSDGQL
jgi:VWFA-related protein